ncbi:MAG: methionyl-tRNA formyltransferase [Oscillospiraceae bacterium]|nr:methionyl-tRNA formyltransferase [Oscillospiraceae bacterium]
MKIVFMGTPDIAVPMLDRIINDGHEVVGVLTQPDKPQGRHYTLTPPPVKVLAQEKGIPVYQPEKMRDGQALEILKELAPELIVVVAYGKILPKEILELPKYGCVNVHASLLPKYRGAGPIQWSVINGEKETGVTTMYMAEGLDTGDMILKMSTPIGEEETAGELYDRLAVLGAECISQTIELIAQGKAPREPQDDSLSSYAPMLSKETGKLDFTRSAKELHCLIRGVSPWPGAYTTLGDKNLKVHSAKLSEGKGKPGELIDEKRMIVACGEGALEFTEVQLAGSKRMTADVFLRGRQLAKGTIFGN